MRIFQGCSPPLRIKVSRDIYSMCVAPGPSHRSLAPLGPTPWRARRKGGGGADGGGADPGGPEAEALDHRGSSVQEVARGA